MAEQKTYEEYRRHCEAIAYDIESVGLWLVFTGLARELRRYRQRMEKKIARAKLAFDQQEAVIEERYADSPKMRAQYEDYLKTGDDNPYDSEPMRAKYAKYEADATAVANAIAAKATKKVKREAVNGQA